MGQTGEENSWWKQLLDRSIGNGAEQNNSSICEAAPPGTCQPSAPPGQFMATCSGLGTPGSATTCPHCLWAGTSLWAGHPCPLPASTHGNAVAAVVTMGGTSCQGCSAPLQRWVLAHTMQHLSVQLESSF